MSSEWYEDDKFNYFWQTYQENPQIYSRVINASKLYNDHFNAIKTASYAAHGLALNALSASPSLDQSTENSEEKIDNQIEFQISDDLLNFYRESYMFKKEKKASEKKKLKQMKDVGITIEHVSGEQVNLESLGSSKNAPLNRAGLKREEELKILYGSGAIGLHLRETRLQMKFDKNFDKYQPKYWPSFPLRINFN